MRKLKLIAIIVAIFLTAGPALQGVVGLWYGTAGLWETLAAIVFVALVVALARCIERPRRQKK